MLELTHGDILKADADALVNTVNCVGFMGRGVAAQFKRAFPKNFRVYEAACKREEVQPGKMLVFETGRLGRPRYVINFPTKRHWRGKSRLVDIERGLEELVAADLVEGFETPFGMELLATVHWVANHEGVPDDGSFLVYRTMLKAVRRLYKRAGVVVPRSETGRTMPFHSLRHTFGSECARRGIPVMTLRDLMGHEDVKTTQRYVTVTSADKRNAIERAFGQQVGNTLPRQAEDPRILVEKP